MVLVEIVAFSFFNYSKLLAIFFIYKRKQVSTHSLFLQQKVLMSVIFFNSWMHILYFRRLKKSSVPCKQAHPCK